jgi:hypothetical protein
MVSSTPSRNISIVQDVLKTTILLYVLYVKFDYFAEGTLTLISLKTKEIFTRERNRRIEDGYN